MMLSFKQFITEQEELVLDTPDVKILESNMEVINSDLEAVTNKPFLNSALFVNMVRGTLERYGILIPPGFEMPMLSTEAETVYTLGESGYYLYMVHNLNEDKLIDGYAQIVDETDLNDLMDMDASELTDKEDDYEQKPWIPPARRDDDSGNTDEYA